MSERSCGDDEGIIHFLNTSTVYLDEWDGEAVKDGKLQYGYFYKSRSLFAVNLWFNAAKDDEDFQISEDYLSALPRQHHLVVFKDRKLLVRALNAINAGSQIQHWWEGEWLAMSHLLGVGLVERALYTIDETLRTLGCWDIQLFYTLELNPGPYWDLNEPDIATAYVNVNFTNHTGRGYEGFLELGEVFYNGAGIRWLTTSFPETEKVVQMHQQALADFIAFGNVDYTGDFDSTAPCTAWLEHTCTDAYPQCIECECAGFHHYVREIEEEKQVSEHQGSKSEEDAPSG